MKKKKKQKSFSPQPLVYKIKPSQGKITKGKAWKLGDRQLQSHEQVSVTCGSRNPLLQKVAPYWFNRGQLTIRAYSLGEVLRLLQ